MAKNRSKKDRIRANKKRLSKASVQVFEKPIKQKEKSPGELFSYDPKLIVNDLKKTFLLVVFILLILLAIALIYT